MKTVTALFTALLATSICMAVNTCANAASPPPTLKTSFDCANARASIEKLICRDPQLTQMDIELMRLYHLALTDERSVPPPDKVTIDQQFWIESRNQCGSGPEPKACAIRRYAERAHQLRQGSAIVRTKDPDRLTEGPLAFRCTGFDTLIAATFFTTQPGVVYLKWANTSITLSQVQSESGAITPARITRETTASGKTLTRSFFRSPAQGQ